MISARSLPASEVGEAASVNTHPVEWWYANLLIEAPGTPLHGMALVTIFSKFTNVIEEVRRLILSPEGGVFADFSSGPLTRGSIQASTTSLNVTVGPNRLEGGYPRFLLHAEGEATSGAYITADIEYIAEVTPEREGYIDDQFKHWVVYRSRGTGTISVGGKSYEVSGLGYVEHLFGTLGWFEPYLGELNPPTFVNGWNWYWTPSAGPDGVVVQAGGFVTEGAPVPFASISIDGRNYLHFASGKFEVLEERAFDGIRYVHKFRLTDRNAAGEVDLTFTRYVAAQRAIKQAGGGNKVAFVSGFAELEGHTIIDGKKYDVSGRSFGSVFTVAMSDPFVAARRLPNVVRVPIGRVLNTALRVMTVGR